MINPEVNDINQKCISRKNLDIHNKYLINDKTNNLVDYNEKEEDCLNYFLMDNNSNSHPMDTSNGGIEEELERGEFYNNIEDSFEDFEKKNYNNSSGHNNNSGHK
ncbi:hypothetical protein PMLGA01_140034400 [Plasmodium malariae]|uniref:Uncharacterized protein n=1 Tax=Plasmodium malariae TaxID=5858 RepID=A0A1C3L2Q1_PLAMA|nr:hypothetical protein PMLGA01_140034400 [Plasmodium malariae]